MRNPRRTPLSTKLASLALSLLACGSLGGCATSATVVDLDTKPIVLDQAQSVKGNRLNTTTLPAGVYLPDFKTDEGIYYRAPSKIVTGGLGMKLLVRGGIFVPSPAEKDQRLGVWWDQQNQSGGFLDKAVSSPTNVHRFDARLVFHTPEDGAGDSAQ